MTNLELINEITECNVALCNLDRYIKHHKPQIYDELCKCTAFLETWTRKPINKIGKEYIPLNARLWCLQNNVATIPVCKICGNHTTWRSTGNTFANWCSISCACKDPDTVAKSKQSRKNKYDNGAFNVEKAKQTRYTSNNGKWHSDNFSEKVKETKLKKHNNATYVNSEKISLTARKTKYKQFLNSTTVKPLFSLDDFLAVDKHQVLMHNFTWRCLKCDTEFVSSINKNWFSKHGHKSFARCPACYPILTPFNTGQSTLEIELAEFIKLHNVEIEMHNRTIISNGNSELDIYIPNKQLAIEFDGLYWHSECIKSDKNYHLNKTKICEDQEIHLVHIFENEWLYKQDIVKSRIKNLLGIYDKTIGARQCKVTAVDSKTSLLFLDENHIQGKAISKVNLGLFYQDELVSLMTFSKPRFSKQYDWELVRFCNKLGWHIPGAASKLLQQFEKHYKPASLVSYADRRWSYSKKNVYQTLGFTLSHRSTPNYWYWKNTEFSSRIKYQKHKLAMLLETFDPELSEIDNMLANGYNRIFDCGNLVYVKQYKNEKG